MMTPPAFSRRSGILVPLFSLTSTRSWGVGEFADLPAFARWLQRAEQAFVQVLPLTEIPTEETSPYSALTAMALDPIFVSLPEVEDFRALGGEAMLPPEDRATLDRVRGDERVDHRAVRALKRKWLRHSYEQFAATQLPGVSPRADRFIHFMREQAWWLDDYAMFRALRREHELRPWWDWPEPLKLRDEAALARAAQRLRGEIYYRKYVQWVAAEQWASARLQARPLQVFGDVPFMISADSPDVWTQQKEFRFDATVGVPPDAFSETGQDWGLPPWRWEVMQQDGFEWMARRARRTAALFDGFRLDHLVGLYRTYMRPLDPAVPPFFEPRDEGSQLALGERLVKIYLASGAEIVAEDLGTVPDFVRHSLLRLGVPGFKVMRWERDWNEPGQPYIDPPDYAVTSVATTGTHDTEPLACWWEELSHEERMKVAAIPTVQRYFGDDISHPARSAPFTRALNDSLIRALLDAGSMLAILPVQDLFGWRDRINTPARIDRENWTWRMPWRVDRLDEIAEARDRASWLASATRGSARSITDPVT
jgi:4-alpha-glucanotransferase